MKKIILFLMLFSVLTLFGCSNKITHNLYEINGEDEYEEAGSFNQNESKEMVILFNNYKEFTMDDLDEDGTNEEITDLKKAYNEMVKEYYTKSNQELFDKMNLDFDEEFEISKYSGRVTIYMSNEKTDPYYEKLAQKIARFSFVEHIYINEYCYINE